MEATGTHRDFKIGKANKPAFCSSARHTTGDELIQDRAYGWTTGVRRCRFHEATNLTTSEFLLHPALPLLSC